jgi:glycosyltransferase involved in cell wall biosynthesis
MKILMIFQTSPYPPDLGPTKRNFPLFRENIKRHEVSVLAFGTAEQETEFRKRYDRHCKEIVFVDNRRPRVLNSVLRLWKLVTGRSSYTIFFGRKMGQALRQLLARETYDVIHCCTTMFGYYQLPKNRVLIGDAHNVEHDSLRRVHHQIKNIFLKFYTFCDYLLLKKEEISVSDKFDIVVTTTERDRQLYLTELPHKIIKVIPNGVDPAFFIPQEVIEEPRTIVYAGLMSYWPNEQGIHYFLDDIFPLILDREPAARIFVVGADPSRQLLRRATSNVIVTGWVEDVRPYFARGQVFVIPLLIGGGIRGKALEAMAMKRPIVTTTLGCEGINLKHEESAIFADTPGDFADAVIRLFNNPELRDRITRKAYQNVVEGYNWEVNGLAFEQVYQSVAHSKGIIDQRRAG